MVSKQGPGISHDLSTIWTLSPGCDQKLWGLKFMDKIRTPCPAGSLQAAQHSDPSPERASR